MATACGKNLAAKMNRRVIIQQVTTTSDGQGGSIETWSDVASIWASIDPLRSWERMQAQQLQTPITHKLTIRYRTGLTTRHRLNYSGRIFDIKEILNPGEANSFLNLQCIETT